MNSRFQTVENGGYKQMLFSYKWYVDYRSDDIGTYGRYFVRCLYGICILQNQLISSWIVTYDWEIMAILWITLPINESNLDS